MEIANCMKCGRLFYNISEVLICPDCRKAADEKMREVEDYNEEHRDADIEQVAEACGVDTEQVERWIRNERIKYSVSASDKISCEGCGRKIHSGKLCEACRKKKVELIQQLSRKLSSEE